MKKLTKKAVRCGATHRRVTSHRRTKQMTHGKAGRTRFVRVSLRKSTRGSV